MTTPRIWVLGQMHTLRRAPVEPVRPVTRAGQAMVGRPIGPHRRETPPATAERVVPCRRAAGTTGSWGLMPTYRYHPPPNWPRLRHRAGPQPGMAARPGLGAAPAGMAALGGRAGRATAAGPVGRPRALGAAATSAGAGRTRSGARGSATTRAGPPGGRLLRPLLPRCLHPALPAGPRLRRDRVPPIRGPAARPARLRPRQGRRRLRERLKTPPQATRSPRRRRCLSAAGTGRRSRRAA
jgi:hypothetical protein